ncbi:LysM domain-containing protein [Snodgrassella alvi]|uniref:LysM peptidoglycan-binding domain-containing protein n=1 Tax=Snodgrassella alvi TaxID=1196083 RepID=UPI00351C8638
MPEKYRTNLDTGTHNIHLARYCLSTKKLAKFDFKLILDPDSTIYFVEVKPGNSLDKIAKANNTAIEILQNMNPEMVNPLNLKIDMKLKYRKRAIKRVITGWKDISTISIAKNNNGNGDPTYCARLNYVLQLLRKDK